MAYKGRRVKKKPLGKNPVFWAAVAILVIVAVLAIWIVGMFSNDTFTVRAPEPTEAPTSMERPDMPTEPTLPPPEANPYGPVDFLLEEESQQITLLSCFRQGMTLVQDPAVQTGAAGKGISRNINHVTYIELLHIFRSKGCFQMIDSHDPYLPSNQLGSSISSTVPSARMR